MRGSTSSKQDARIVVATGQSLRCMKRLRHVIILKRANHLKLVRGRDCTDAQKLEEDLVRIIRGSTEEIIVYRIQEGSGPVSIYTFYTLIPRAYRCTFSQRADALTG